MILARFNVAISWGLKAIMFALIWVAFFERNYVGVVGVTIDFLLSFLPAILQRNSRKHLPWTLDLAVSFAFLLQALAIAFNLNHNPEWWFWDEIQHSVGSFVIGMMAFHLVFTVQFLGRAIMGVGMTGFFIFITTMGVGAIWEVAEFYSDKFLGTNTQQSLAETMRDLQLNAMGAFLIAIIGMRYVYVKMEELNELRKLKILKKELKEERLLMKKIVNNNSK